jgi:hypothetical protein
VPIGIDSKTTNGAARADCDISALATFPSVTAGATASAIASCTARATIARIASGPGVIGYQGPYWISIARVGARLRKHAASDTAGATSSSNIAPTAITTIATGTSAISSAAVATGGIQLIGRTASDGIINNDRAADIQSDCPAAATITTLATVSAIATAAAGTTVAACPAVASGDSVGCSRVGSGTIHAAAAAPTIAAAAAPTIAAAAAPATISGNCPVTTYTSISNN